MVNRLDAQRRAYILHALCEGMSQRACERIFAVSNKTVAKLFEEAGDMAIQYVASLSKLKIEKIQADELHAFVAAKDKHLEDKLIPDEDAGTVWGYLAMCAETKLVFAYHLSGTRDQESTEAFMNKIAAKLVRNERKEFLVKPQIFTDGLKAYPEAVRNVFGADAMHGMYVKQYSKTDKNGEPIPGARFIGARREKQQGNPATSDIHTAYIERQNLNLRMGNRRYTRKSNGFSKKMLNHERHLALWIMYHNLCWMPRPERPTRAERKAQSTPRWKKRLPAAMAAGLTDKLWAIEDLLALTDAFVAERAKKAKPKDEPVQAPPAEGAAVDSAATHWVYHSFFGGHSCKVHAAHCCNCRNGQGKRPGEQASGKWLPFHSLEEAVAAAKEMQPYRTTICRMCLEPRRKNAGGAGEWRHGRSR